MSGASLAVKDPLEWEDCLPILLFKCLGAARVRQVEFGEERRGLCSGALFAAKPFPAPVFGVKGNCSCPGVLLLPWACPGNSGEPQVLRKIKNGKTLI